MNINHTLGIVLTAMLVISDCHAKGTPTQVVYRSDDHRYLELKGWNCEGELWYTDTKRGIHTEPVSQFYQIFSKTYIHPSEKYIAVPTKNVSEFIISKDYGKNGNGANLLILCTMVFLRCLRGFNSHQLSHLFSYRRRGA